MSPSVTRGGGARIVLRSPLIRGQAAWMGGLLRRYGVPVTVHVQLGTHDWAYAMSALRYLFTFLADNWRQAAANDEPGVP